MNTSEDTGAVDEKTLFAALQSELNARAQARAAINTAHIQTILLFLGAYVAASAYTKIYNSEVPIVISIILPLVSAYFISLYIHNDLLIGALNRALRKLEERSKIDLSLRYYDFDSAGRALNARRSSQFAVYAICLACPFVVLLFNIFKYMGESVELAKIDVRTATAAVLVVIITATNIIRLSRLDKKRSDFVKS